MTHAVGERTFFSFFFMGELFDRLIVDSKKNENVSTSLEYFPVKSSSKKAIQ